VALRVDCSSTFPVRGGSIGARPESRMSSSIDDESTSPRDRFQLTVSGAADQMTAC